MSKRIEEIHIKPSELKFNFENPRKITKDGIENLKKSFEKLGNHDVIKIDEYNNIISGSQRIKALLEIGIDQPVLCKKLIGYSEKELKAINVQSNRHEGEWDYEKLDEWEEDLNEYEFSNQNMKESEKEINIKPYDKIHFLISVDIKYIEKIKKIINNIKDIEGIEIEQSQN